VYLVVVKHVIGTVLYTNAVVFLSVYVLTKAFYMLIKTG